MKLVGGARLELGNEMDVEVAGLGRLGVHEQSAAPDVIGLGRPALEAQLPPRRENPGLGHPTAPNHADRQPTAKEAEILSSEPDSAALAPLLGTAV
jgi:hypothetical protein